jgi:hypothetical protein
LPTQVVEVGQVDRPAVEAPKPPLGPIFEDDTGEPEHPRPVVRGIAYGLLISVPIWALFVFALYLLI